MVSIFRKKVETAGIDNINIDCGDGQNLPYSDEMFDAVFSMFGLMFFLNRNKGYAEIFRTLKPGGKILVSSWAPVSESPLMQVVFGAIRAMKPETPEPGTDNDSLENPQFFENELLRAGFKEIEIHPVTCGFSTNSPEEFWGEMVRSNVPVAMMKNSMPDEEWTEKESLALEYLHNRLAPLPVSLSSKAWLGCGVKEKRGR